MRSVVTAESKIRFGETVLNDFFNLFALGKEPTRDARDLTTMTFEQLLECSFIARRGSGDQHIIG